MIRFATPGAHHTSCRVGGGGGEDGRVARAFMSVEVVDQDEDSLGPSECRANARFCVLLKDMQSSSRIKSNILAHSRLKNTQVSSNNAAETRRAAEAKEATLAGEDLLQRDWADMSVTYSGGPPQQDLQMTIV